MTIQQESLQQALKATALLTYFSAQEGKTFEEIWQEILVAFEGTIFPGKQNGQTNTN